MLLPKMTLWLLGTLLGLMITAPLGAVSIITKDGQTFTGKILEQGEDYYQMEMEDGVQVRIGKDQVELVDKDDDGVDPSEYKKRYAVLGGAFFYPAWGNLVAGYFFEGFGARVSGGYWGSNDWGVQLDLSLKVAEDKEFLNNLCLVAGATSPKDYLNQAYFGFGMDVIAAGFLLEGALVGGKDRVTGDFTPVLLFQLGYAVRLD